MGCRRAGRWPQPPATGQLSAAQPAPSPQNGCCSATSIRSEQCIPHLKPVEHRFGRVLQRCHPAAQILDVVELVLDGLTNDVGSAAVELLGRCIKLGAEGVGKPGRDLHHGSCREVAEMSMTLLLGMRPMPDWSAVNQLAVAHPIAP